MADKNIVNDVIGVIGQMLADFHLHTNKSDGVLTIEQLISYAKKNNIEWMAITDHNTLQACIDLWNKYGADLSDPYIEVDGIDIVSGAEVTCRVNSVSNTKGNSTKVHLTVYGVDMNPDSLFARLMAVKHRNDVDYDLARLNYLLSLNPKYKISEEEVLEWLRKNNVEGEPSNKQIMDFLDDKGIDLGIASIRQLQKRLEGMPPVERLNIDAEMLIRVAHASGGVVVFAHPAHNLKRTSNKDELIDTLLRAGLDGFELLYNGANADVARRIDGAVKRCAKKKSIIYTGGSDTHNLLEGNTIGMWNKNKPITVESQERGLIKVANRMKKEHELGCRQTRMVDAVAERYVSQCEGFVNKGTTIKSAHSEKKNASHSKNSKKHKYSPYEYFNKHGGYDDGYDMLD